MLLRTFMKSWINETPSTLLLFESFLGNLLLDPLFEPFEPFSSVFLFYTFVHSFDTGKRVHVKGSTNLKVTLILPTAIVFLCTLPDRLKLLELRACCENMQWTDRFSIESYRSNAPSDSLNLSVVMSTRHALISYGGFTKAPP